MIIILDIDSYVQTLYYILTYMLKNDIFEVKQKVEIGIYSYFISLINA